LGTCRTKQEQTRNKGVAAMEGLTELQARQDELAREWRWLHDTLNKVARVRAEQGDAHAFRLLQAQAMAVGQRRIELSVRIAEMEGMDKTA
jgi:hypothetical protein